MKNSIRNFAATFAFALAANLTKTLLVVLAMCCTSVGILAQQGGNCAPGVTADFTVTPTADPLTFEFTAVPTNFTNPITFTQWVFGNEVNQPQGMTVLHTFPQKGVYPVSVHIGDGSCQAYNVHKPVEVGGCTMQANYTTILNAVLGNANFSSNIFNGLPPYTYDWKFCDFGGWNDGATLSTSADYNTYMSAIPQNKFVKLRVIDANGCVNEAVDSTLNLPHACAGFTATITKEQLPTHQTRVTAIAAGGTPPYTYNYAWNDDDNLYGNNGTGSAILSYSSRIIYNIQDNTGCHLTIRDSVIIVPSICATSTLGFSISQTQTTPTQVQVQANPTGGVLPYDYAFIFVNYTANMIVAVNHNPTAIINTSASTGIYFYVTDANGCHLGIYDTIMINNNLPCTTGSCVFPGDADYDGIANQYDVLTLGVNYGSTGAARTDQSLTWSAHEATDFATVTPTILVNKKHADCNGNGTIDYSDTTAIGLNYQRTHNGVSPTNRPEMTGVPVFLEFEVDTAFLQTGVPNAIYADVFVGNSTTQANNLYGVAFSLNYPSAFINPDSAVQVIYDNTSFMGSPNDMLVFGHDLRADEQFDVALTRTNQIGATGNGRICRVKWIITENISGKGNSMNSILTRLMETMQVTLTGLRTNDNQLAPIASQGSGSSVVLVGKTITGIDDKAALSSIKIYPNPVQNGSLFIDAKAIFIQNYQLSNTLGQVLQTENVQQNKTQIDVQNLPSGVYFIRIATDKGALTQKIVVKN